MTSALDNLRIVRREEWGAGLSSDWPASPGWVPIPHTPQFLVVHHTVTTNRQGDAATIRAIWRYHARTQGWGDIRYHYLIGQDGLIYEGRWRGNRPANIFVEGGQSMASNTGKIGVVLLGQFEPSVSSPAPGEPTPEALNSLVKLLGAIAYDLDLDPLGQTYHTVEDKAYYVISGHRDHYRTTCPGGNLYVLLRDIRESVVEEVQRLRDSEELPERVLNLTPTANQVAWGKSAWPNLLWGSDYLYSGAWWDTLYYSLIEVGLPEEVVKGQITGLELVLTGQHSNYLRETGGDWQASVLPAPLRGDTSTKVSFTALQSASTVAVFSPTLSVDDLQPGRENRLVIDPADLTAVQQAAAGGYLAIRLAGPTSGRRLFAWSGDFGRGGPVVKISFQINAPPAPDLSDVMVKDIAFERTPQGQIQLAALVANLGQAQTPGVVEVSFYVDGQFLTSGVIDPLPAGKSGAVRAQQNFLLTGRRTIMAIVDQPNRLPEEQEGNNVLVELIDFGSPQDHLADMIIREVSLGQAPFIEGDDITFEAVVKNIGAALTGDVVGVSFWVDGRYITFGAVEPLAAGATQTIKAVAPWQAVAGGHKLLTIVDDVNRFEEKSETNNRFELDFKVLDRTAPALPDSTVESIDFETGRPDQIILTATVSNIGHVPTPDVVGVAFFVDDRYATYGVAQPMTPGATEIVRAVQPLSLNGLHKITAIVDDVNRYDEISDQNNVLIRHITFPPT